MLKDITIGQYFPGHSVLHRMDPRMKIMLTLVYIVLLFLSTNFVSMGVGYLLLGICYGISGVPLRMTLKSLRPILPIVLFTALLNMFLVDGRVLVEFWFFRITIEGVLVALLMAARIVGLIAGSSLLTYTTSPIALTDGIERLLSPFKRFKLPVHELAMMMTIALRFIPTLIEETDKIMSAQKARGADMETGSLMKRARALIPILIPLFVSAFRRADDLALAMECRCYRGGEGRTRMRQLSLRYYDFLAGLLVVIILTAVIWLNGMLPAIRSV